MISRLITKGVLKLLVIDEAHLFTKFGVYFRSEFAKLEPALFRKPVVSRNGATLTKIPILFMTATASKQILEQI